MDTSNLPHDATPAELASPLIDLSKDDELDSRDLWVLRSRSIGPQKAKATSQQRAPHLIRMHFLVDPCF